MGMFENIISSIKSLVSKSKKEHADQDDIVFPMVVAGVTSEDSERLYDRPAEKGLGWNMLFNVSNPVKVSELAVCMKFEMMRERKVLSILGAERDEHQFVDDYAESLSQAESLEDIYGKPIPLTEKEKEPVPEMRGVSLPVDGYQTREVRVNIYGDYCCLGKSISDSGDSSSWEGRFFAGQEEIETLYFQAGPVDSKRYGVFDCGIKYNLDVSSKNSGLHNVNLDLLNCIFFNCVRTLELLDEKEKYQQKWKSIQQEAPELFRQLKAAENLEDTVKIGKYPRINMGDEEYVVIPDL